MMQPIAIVGPTASGKSEFALRIAQALNGEIINCDSLQFYRGFDIGTAKPSIAERELVPHHLFDVKNWNEDYDAGSYARDAKSLIANLLAAGRQPIICGGSGLYLRALLSDKFDQQLPSDPSLRARLAEWPLARLRAVLLRLDPRRAGEIHPHDRYRLQRAVELRVLLKAPIPRSESADPFARTIILDPARSQLRDRIAARVDAMFAAGLVLEVRQLLDSGVRSDAKPMQAIGYKQVVEWLAEGGDPKRAQDCRDLIYIATCQYAKRQQTWFNKTTAWRRLTAAPIGPAFDDFIEELRRP